MNNQDELKSNGLETALNILRRGGVILFPTDTVYGIGCRFDRPAAIERIRNIKKTTQFLPILVSDINQAHRLAFMNNAAVHLANKYWPGGLTIVMTSKVKDEKIGVRMPDSALIKNIIEKLNSPIVGTSANFHNQKAVYRYQDLDPKLIKLVDYVIKGECDKKVESTVVDATVSPTKILREGTIRIR